MTQQPRLQGKLSTFAGITLIVVALCISYWPTLQGGFIWDDELLITKNDLVKAPDGLLRIWLTTQAVDYWPITNSAFWTEWRLWGMNTTGYHFLNLLLQITNCLLIWVLLRKITLPGAYLAALLYAVHPVNVESVAWIAQLKNTLSLLFFLLSIILYLRSDSHANQTVGSRTLLSNQDGYYWFSLLAFTFAMLCKGAVVILPLVLLLIAWWRSKTISREDFIRTIPFFAVGIILSLVNIWFRTHGSNEVIRTLTFAQRLWGAGTVVCFYLYKDLLPTNLAFIYPQWNFNSGHLSNWIPLISVISITVVLWLCRGKNWGRALFFAWLFYCVALLPVMGFADIYFMKFSPVADHYQYIALIAVTALAGAAWTVWFRRLAGWGRIVALVIPASVVVAFTAISWQQSRLYASAETLYLDTLEKNPSCWLAENNLGVVYADSEQETKAMERFQRALAIKPGYAEPLYNIGRILAKQGQTNQAIQYYQQALESNPNYAQAHSDLGVALASKGRTEEAISHYRAALQIRPTFAEAHNNLGNALLKLNQLPEATAHFQQAMRLQPQNAEAENSFGTALLQAGNAKQAIAHFELALQANPGSAQAHANMGIGFMMQGQPKLAIEHYQQALQLKPNDCDVYANLALAYAALDDSGAAISAAKKSVELAIAQNQKDLVSQVTAWLANYQSQHPDQKASVGLPPTISPNP